MIRATNIGYSFGGVGTPSVLEDISFGVSAGQIFAIVGPSGCGKTTLLRLISGYLKPTTGSVELDEGKPLSGRQSIGIVYQDNRLVPWRNVMENVRLPLEILSQPLDSPLLDELLGVLRLTQHARKYPAQLSGGQQERSALARALVFSPSFLLLDEPLGSTDYVHRLEIEDYIFEAVKRDKKFCVLVTHDLEQAVAIADRILVLGFSAAVQKKETVEVPKHIQELRPSEARVTPETANFLASLLATYRKVSSL